MSKLVEKLSISDFINYVMRAGVEGLFQNEKSFMVHENNNETKFKFVFNIFLESRNECQCSLVGISPDGNFNDICKNVFPPKQDDGTYPIISNEEAAQRLTNFILENLFPYMGGGRKKSRRRRRQANDLKKKKSFTNFDFKGRMKVPDYRLWRKVSRRSFPKR